MADHGSPQFQLAFEEKELQINVEVGSPGIFLSPDANAGNGAPALVASGATPAVTHAQRLAGTAASGVVVEARSPPLAQTYFLNLSRPIVGKFFWKTQASEQAGQEQFEVRYDLRSGDDVVLIGGASYQASWADCRDTLNPRPMAPWSPCMGFEGRSEIVRLPAGSILKLRLTVLAAHGDTFVGTGSDVQSVITFYYYDSDPFSSPFYLEQGVLYTAGEGAAESEPQDGATGLPLGLAAAGAGLALRVRRRRHAGVIALLFVAGLAGCTSRSHVEPQSTDGGATQDPVVVSREPLPPGGGARQNGSLEISALDGDRANLPLAEAHVTVVGTNLFGSTGRDGTLRFDGLVPGHYRVVVTGPKNYGTGDEDVEVAAGELTKVRFSLHKAGATQAGDRDHRHDDWVGREEVTILSQHYSWAMQTLPAPVPYNCKWGCGWLDVRPPGGDDGYVFPGTNRVEVKATWTGGPPELQLAISTTTATQQLLGPRGSGVPFSYAFFPQEADLGHQKYSRWVFSFAAITESGIGLYEPLASGSVEMDLTITIHKGVVPLEPAHRDYWESNTTKRLISKSVPVAVGTAPYPTKVTSYGWQLDRVPPGTKELRGRFWSKPFAYDPINVSFTPRISFVSGSNPQWTAVELEEHAANPGKIYTFVLPVKRGDADPFYSLPSWWFSPVFGGTDPVPGDAYVPSEDMIRCTGKLLFLTVDAIKDPDFRWQDE